MADDHTVWRTRLYIEDLPSEANGAQLELAPPQAHLLRNVLRCRVGERLRLFNGVRGEYGATVIEIGKKSVQLRCDEKLRPAEPLNGLALAFAPIKRIDYVVQKAVEMGVSHLQPVITQRTQGNRFSLERMRANIIEAAEQSERVSLPFSHAPLPLDHFLDHHDAATPLFFCDERRRHQTPHIGPLPASATILIGPEGGFTETEAERIDAHLATRPLSLGPYILRADTAVVAALALVQFASLISEAVHAPHDKI